MARGAQLLGRVVVERIRFRFYRRARARIGPAAEALRDNSADAEIARGRHEIIGAFDSQAIGAGKGAVEGSEIEASQIGHLVHDDVRRRRSDGGPHGVPVEAVGDDGLRAELTNDAQFLHASGRTGHRMAARHENRNEPAPDRAGRTCHENAHTSLA